MKSKWKKVLRNMINNVWYYALRLFKAMPIIVMLITPYISMWAVIKAYESRGRWAVGGEWFVPLLLYVVIYVLNSINRVFNDRLDDLPVARKRFTKRSQSGDVLFKRSDTYEMLEYLAAVEDYCERYGKYRSEDK